ncbi:DEAD/DEAH box helicase [Acetatifactor aquisgranensis]|uniref:DEAD/DEAH box helicase n=1 Tax=Acetatifactor aquisgranensis TaxID=2941233 RepID=UPI00203F4E95|nr:DEAD/DEAH box helicase [Acetatifactor aquisgranensis]
MNEWNEALAEDMAAEQDQMAEQNAAAETEKAAERAKQSEGTDMNGTTEWNETEELQETTEEWDEGEDSDAEETSEETESSDEYEELDTEDMTQEQAAEHTDDVSEKKKDARTDEGDADGVDSSSLASIEPLLDDRIVRAVREMGFEKLTPIQVQAIPYLLDGEDIIGQAQTGTGKTAAFAIPALQKIDPDLRKLQTIILCPTRELAMQAAEEIRHIAKYMHGIKVLPVYGGQDISKQIRGLKEVQIVVGTPGRVMDHMRRRTIKLDYVNMVVLDEADEMLDMGFREDMELILGEIPNAHQTALFSATMPQPILEIANQFQKDARLVRVAAKELTIPLVSQRYYRVKSQDKDAACIRLLEYYQPKLCLIFCNTKIKVDEVSEMLKKADFRAEGLHGDMSQHQRDVAMNHFRNGSTNILIATDVAARGIDVDNVEVVINYDVPQDNEYYVHRIGRTGRAGKTGRSFTFVSGRELFRVKQIERFCHTAIEERELPAASKVMKAKAEKYLNQSWELHGRDDIDLMKSYVERKMEEEGCDALDLAAVMLKYHIGDIGPEIEADDYESRGGRGERGRRGRRRRGRDEERRGRDRDENRESRRRRGREEDREERRGRDRDEERESRRRFDRDEDRGRDRDEERESRRRFDRDEDREERRSRDRDEERESRRRRGREEDREERRGRDRDEERESRRRRDRDDDRESRRRFDREESRDSRRKRDRGEDRGIHGRFERESSRESRRRRDDDRDSRRKRDREESRSSRLRDIRMEGSEKGLAFSFPKKKRK